MKRPSAAVPAGKRQHAERPPPNGAPGLCVAGEALIDFLPRKTADDEPCFLPKAGGAPFNVCIAARRLGLPVHFFSGISTDMFGQDLYSQLDREKVDLSMSHRVARPTTLAFVSKPPGADVRYAFFKENSADRALTSGDSAKAMEGKLFGAVHMSLGAVTFEDEHMRQTFTELFRIAQTKGSFTSFDANLRPNMIEQGAEAYRKRIEDFVGFVDLMKSSDADIEFLYGEGADLAKVAETWLDLGARLVVITQGSKGASAYYRPAAETVGSFLVEPPTKQPNTIDAAGRPAPVADTVGAGDTCMGGLLFGLLGGGDQPSLAPQLAGGVAWDDAATKRLKDIMELAVGAAAINVSRHGCDPPTYQEVKTALAALA